MIPDYLAWLRDVDEVVLGENARPGDVVAFEKRLGVALPTEYKAFLELCNVVRVFAGFARILGLSASVANDVETWNDEDYWKFAWESKLDGFLSFAETAWGDQYCFGIEGLSKGDESVFFLDALSMTPSVIAPSFREFLESEFKRLATDPFDDMTKLARAKFGELQEGQHITYVPSILIGGSEDIDNVVVMDARAAMVTNGDIAAQVDAAPDDAQPQRVETWRDEAGRERLRLFLPDR